MVSDCGINGSSIFLIGVKMAAIRAHFKFPFSDWPGKFVPTRNGRRDFLGTFRKNLPLGSPRENW
jgi:hypothetical protein